MKHFLAILFVFAASQTVLAQEYSVSVPQKPKEITYGHLNLGGSNPAGNRISFNSFYMEVDGKPFIPIMGEIHFSRFPNQYWEEEILKMKAGGINVIATYVFWNMHEAQEGVFDWSGDKDLRQFLELCRRHNMYALVRIGPFCHGEIRNGGLPDWIYGRPFEVRSNDEGYLFYVKRLYRNIAGQMKDLYYKDGGTIIGIQLENELQHSAAPWSFTYSGQEREYTTANYDAELTNIGVSVQERRTAYAKLGSDHLATLKKMAQDEGMIVPLYTVTGWGNAAILEDEAIPVTSAYPYPFWAAPSMSGFYLFKDIQKNPDYSPVRYDGNKYPSFCAEMGAGIQITYARRPRVSASAAEALMLRSLGSGANGIGYYMYHGGLTPQREGGAFYSDEPMGVPKISYDFQAPLGEYGKARDSYFNLRLIHLFTENFAGRLAPMGVVLPETNSRIKPEDRETLRYAVRSDGKAGFVFLHNFQDHDDRTDQKTDGLNIQLSGETIRFPSFTLTKGASVILPFNMSVNAALLKYAMVQPLAVVQIDEKQHYFFYTHNGFVPEYVFAQTSVKKVSGKKTVKNGNIHIIPSAGFNGSFTVTDTNGNETVIITLTREQALHFNQLKNSICITDATLLQNDTQIQLQSRTNKFTVAFPSVAKPDFGKYKVAGKKSGLFTVYEVEIPAVNVNFEVKEVNKQRYTFKMDKKEFSENLSDIILDIDYVGDNGVAFIDGRMINDNLYYGHHWQTGLKQYAGELSEKGMYFYFKPMKKDASYLIDFEKEKIPDFGAANLLLNVRSIKAIPEYKLEFTFQNNP
ncbi:MAG: beta-galactosidase [Bacteroidales bacterium]|nr:beta-galactosidase [Bacteroidales bacterium]